MPYILYGCVSTHQKFCAGQNTVILQFWGIQFFKIVINSHSQSCYEVNELEKNIAYKVKKIYSNSILT